MKLALLISQNLLNPGANAEDALELLHQDRPQLSLPGLEPLATGFAGMMMQQFTEAAHRQLCKGSWKWEINAGFATDIHIQWLNNKISWMYPHITAICQPRVEHSVKQASPPRNNQKDISMTSDAQLNEYSLSKSFLLYFFVCADKCQMSESQTLCVVSLCDTDVPSISPHHRNQWHISTFSRSAISLAKDPDCVVVSCCLL